jgi:hypothetical protein
MRLCRADQPCLAPSDQSLELGEKDGNIRGRTRRFVQNAGSGNVSLRPRKLGIITIFWHVTCFIMQRIGAAEHAVKQKTLLLFQLLLAVYAFYAVVTYSDNLQVWVPLLCLIAMFTMSKVEAKLTSGGKKAGATSRENKGDTPKKQVFDPLECLLKSKNVLLLTDAIHQLLRDLGLEVIRSPHHNALDRIVRLPGNQLALGLKILSDIQELSPEWDKWEALTSFDLTKGGELRLVVVGSNSITEEGGGRPRFTNFSAPIQSFLAEQKIVALTTLTLFKMYLLCKQKNLQAGAIFRLVHCHPGGVFRLEDYAKRPRAVA